MHARPFPGQLNRGGQLGRGRRDPAVKPTVGGKRKGFPWGEPKVSSSLCDLGLSTHRPTKGPAGLWAGWPCGPAEEGRWLQTRLRARGLGKQACGLVRPGPDPGCHQFFRLRWARGRAWGVEARRPDLGTGTSLPGAQHGEKAPISWPGRAPRPEPSRSRPRVPASAHSRVGIMAVLWYRWDVPA